MNISAKTVVIGAGPAGIAAAIGHGPGALIIEKGTAAGGLALSLEFGSTIFDLGGHSFHTPHEEIRQLVYSSLEMEEQQREARCYAFGKLIPYPFQSHFQSLPDQEIISECSEGLLKARPGPQAATNFKEYLSAKFGAGIARHFLFPYNRKLWGERLEQMSVDWVEERVASAELREKSRRMTDGKRQALHTGTLVAYPASGGFGEIFQALSRNLASCSQASGADSASRSVIDFNTSVAKIDPAVHELNTACGRKIKWQQLISTLPITELVRMIDGFPAELVALCEKLEFVPLRLIMVVLTKQLHTEVQRIYCADSTSPAHKIVLNNNSSSYLRSLPKHGILGEISLVNAAAAESLESSFLRSLNTLGLLENADDVSCLKTIDIKHGYPIPTLERSKIIAAIKEKLRSYDIYTVGRFAEWDYINADEALHRGLTLGKLLASV